MSKSDYSFRAWRLGKAATRFKKVGFAIDYQGSTWLKKRAFSKKSAIRYAKVRILLERFKDWIW